MNFKSHVVELLHHNPSLGEIPDLAKGKDHMPPSLLNPLAKHGGTIPTSPICGYDANWGILCKDQDKGVTSPTLWVTDKSDTLLSKDLMTPGSLHLNSTPWELKHKGGGVGRAGSMSLINDAFCRS